jgi:hypothetical protein
VFGQDDGGAARRVAGDQEVLDGHGCGGEEEEAGSAPMGCLCLRCAPHFFFFQPPLFPTLRGLLASLRRRACVPLGEHIYFSLQIFLASSSTAAIAMPLAAGPQTSAAAAAAAAPPPADRRPPARHRHPFPRPDPAAPPIRCSAQASESRAPAGRSGAAGWARRRRRAAGAREAPPPPAAGEGCHLRTRAKKKAAPPSRRPSRRRRRRRRGHHPGEGTGRVGG